MKGSLIISGGSAGSSDSVRRSSRQLRSRLGLLFFSLLLAGLLASCQLSYVKAPSSDSPSWLAKFSRPCIDIWRRPSPPMRDHLSNDNDDRPRLLLRQSLDDWLVAEREVAWRGIMVNMYVLTGAVSA